MRSLCAFVTIISIATAAWARGPRAALEPTAVPVSGALFSMDPATGAARLLMKINGQSFGPPVMAGKTLVVSTSDKHVVAIDPATGAVRWDRRSEQFIFGLAADAKAVYVGQGSILEALDAATGKTLWTHNNDIPVLNPVLADGLVIFNSFDGPVAIEQETGQLRWQMKVQWGYFVISPMSDKRVCVWKPDEIFVVDTPSGKTTWHTSADMTQTAPGALPSPAAGMHDMICQLRGTERNAESWSLHALDAASGRPLWRAALGDHPAVGPRTLLSKNWVYSLVDDHITAHDRATGIAQWQLVSPPIEAGGTPIAENGQVLFVPELDGPLAGYDAKTGAFRWRIAGPDHTADQIVRFGGICISDGSTIVSRNVLSRK